MRLSLLLTCFCTAALTTRVGPTGKGKQKGLNIRRHVKSLGARSKNPVISLPISSTHVPEVKDVDFFAIARESEKIMTFADLDVALGAAHQKDSEDIIGTCMILVSHELFQKDQLPLMIEAINKNYNNYLRCMLFAKFPWHANAFDLYWFMIKSHRAPWSKRRPWEDLVVGAIWSGNMEAIVKADNARFIPYLKRKDAKTAAKLFKVAEVNDWFTKYDAGNLVEYFYEDLTPITGSLVHLAKNGCYNIIKLLIDKGIELDFTTVKYAHVIRHPRVLQLLYHNGFDRPPGKEVLFLFALKGLTDILKVVHEKYPDIKLGTISLRTAASKGHLEFLKWCHQEGLLDDDHQGIVASAAARGHLPIVKWLHGLESKDFIVGEFMTDVVMKGYIEIVKWVHSVNPDWLPRESRYLKGICCNDHLELLQWVKSMDPTVSLTQEHLDLAAFYGSLSILKWWYYKVDKSVQVGQSGLNWACKHGSLDAIHWIYKKSGRLPSMQGIFWASCEGHLQILKWVYKKDKSLFPDQECMNAAAEYSQTNVMSWIFKNNNSLLPQLYRLKLMVMFNRSKVIRWVARNSPSTLLHPALLELARKRGSSLTRILERIHANNTEEGEVNVQTSKRRAAKYHISAWRLHREPDNYGGSDSYDTEAEMEDRESMDEQSSDSSTPSSSLLTDPPEPDA